MIAQLPNQLQNDLNIIRIRAEEHYTGLKNEFEENSCDPMAWADHSIEMLTSWLLDEEQKQLLASNPWDLFLLHASAYLWDIGLVNTDGADRMVGFSEGRAPSDPSIFATLRRNGRDFILTHWKALGIGDGAIAAALADIREHEWQDHEEGRGSIQSNPVFDGVAINQKLITFAIRLARDLNPKVPETASRLCGFLSPPAARVDQRFSDAFYIMDTGPHPYLTSTIQMKIRCRDLEIHRVLKHHERDVQKKLQQANRMVSPRFLFSDVIFEIDPDGYTPIDLKFSVDTSAALKLLTGNRLYSDNRVFLRELVQNAVDACHLRKRFERDYEPAISIRFNDDISVVTVRDNGIGMDRQWIEKYFLTIGISLYQSTEVRTAQKQSRIDFSFISQFGIGFLSSFLVARKIVIKTRKAGHPGLMLTISNLRDYFDVRTMDAKHSKPSDFSPGTEVTLHLKESKINYCRSLEYTGYLKTNLRFLNVPVTLRDQNRNIATIGRDKLSYENSETADIDFIAPLEFMNSEGYLLLRAKKNVDHIFTIDTAKGGVSVFQDGIFVTQLDALLPEGARQHVIGRINLLGEEKCALSMDRNRIFWTDGQLAGIKKAIRRALATSVNLFLKAVDSQNVASQTRQSIINNLAIFFDFNEVDDVIHQRLCEPIRRIVEKRFRDFIRIHFAHTFRAEGIPEADGYGQIWQQRILDSFQKGQQHDRSSVPTH